MLNNVTGRTSVKAVVSTADDNMLLAIDSAIGGYVDRTISLRSVIAPASPWRSEIAEEGTILAILDVSSFEDASREIEKVTRLSQDPKIIIISRGSPEALEPLVKRVSAVIPSEDVEDLLVHVMHVVLAGMSVVPNTLLRISKNEPWLMKGDPDMERLKSLSFTESRVLLSLTEGMSIKQIAKEIDISDNTVRVHVRNIFLKLGVQNRTQAALLATRFRHTEILHEKTIPLRIENV